MEWYEVIGFIIGIPFFLALLYFLSVLFGHGFRSWNEGDDYDADKEDQWARDKKPKSVDAKTVVIGFILVVIWLVISNMLGCGD